MPGRSTGTPSEGIRFLVRHNFTSFFGFLKKVIFAGYTYEPERGNAILQNDGSLAAWSTISYANGPGFLEHFTNDTDRAWTDIRSRYYT